jgi:hypothetical protein
MNYELRITNENWELGIWELGMWNLELPRSIPTPNSSFPIPQFQFFIPKFNS